MNYNKLFTPNQTDADCPRGMKAMPSTKSQDIAEGSAVYVPILLYLNLIIFILFILIPRTI